MSIPPSNIGWRHTLCAACLRLYPFLSGGGTLANHRLLTALAGPAPSGCVWARSPGGPLLVPLDDWVGRAVYFAGDLDRKVSRICRWLVRPGDTCIDVGANIGLVTLLLAHLTGSTGHVHAIEPNPANVELLRASLERSRYSHATVHPVAVGDHPGKATLAIPTGNRGAASLVNKRIEDPASEVTVQVLPLDALPGILTAPVRLMKLDVEGFEAKVLAGAATLFAETTPDAVLFESNDGSTPNSGPVFQSLFAHGYAIFAIPRRYFALKLIPIDPASSLPPPANDFLAILPHRVPEYPRR